MRFPSLLLVAMMVVSPMRATDSTQPGLKQQPGEIVAPTADEYGQALDSLTRSSELASGSDNICYKIRAYIFKRDDDHAPVLKGSTTCGPRQPRARDVGAPKVRLVPAN
jgi:hypothetical protein